MRRNLTFLALASAALFGVWLRTHGIGERGITGSDTVYYASLAEKWADDGQPHYSIDRQIRVYRPVPLYLFGLSYRLFGKNDSALKWVNVLADTFSIALVFWIGWSLCGDVFPALCAATSYSLLPKAIEMSRLELVHPISTTMVLLAIVFFLLQDRASDPWRKTAFLAGSGVATGLAVLSHEELIFVAPSFVLCLLLSESRSGPRGPGTTLRVLLYLASVLAVSVRGILEQVGPVVRLAGQRPGKTVLSSEPSHVLLRLLYDSIVVNGSIVLFGLFVSLGLLAAIGSLGPGRRRGIAGGLWWPQQLPALVVVGYAACCAVALRYYPVRVFLPMMPLVLIAVFVYLSALPLARYRAALGATTLALIVAFNFLFYDLHLESRAVDFRAGTVPDRPRVELDPANVRSFRDEVFARSWTREVFDLLADKVSEDSRLLVTPAIAYSYPGRRVLQLDCYFGDNAVYAVDHAAPLQALVRAKKIRYVLFTPQHLNRGLESRTANTVYRYGGRWRLEKTFVLGAMYGFRPGEYSLQREWLELRRFLQSRNARRIGSSHEEASFASPSEPPRQAHLLFELPPR